MPITEEIISKDAVLNGLNAEQKAAIIALSANSETAAINTKFAEVHNELDAMVKNVTGVNKDGGEKTSAYIERMLKEPRTKMAELEQIKKDLEEKLAKNGNLDEETKKALEEKDKEVATLKAQYNTLNDKYKDAEKQHSKDLFEFRLNGDLATAMGGFTFAEGLNEQALATLKSAAMAQVRGMNPDYINDGKGGTVLVFKDQNGVVMNNPENHLNPVTASEMLKDAFTKMGILAQEHGGAGGAGGHGGKGGFGNARTQVEAMSNIESTLMSRGLTRGSEAFRSEMMKIINENLAAYNALPVR